MAETNSKKWKDLEWEDIRKTALKRLSKDDVVDVRIGVAWNPATEQSILRELAQDKDERVRNQALKMLTIKRQPNFYAKQLAEKGDEDAIRYLEYLKKKNN